MTPSVVAAGPRGRSRRVTNSQVRDLAALDRAGDHDELVRVVRERLADDPRLVTSAWVKGWLGRRWRDLFLTEARRDDAALATATRVRDRRPERQRLAQRFLARDAEDWRLELPAYDEPRARHSTLVYCPSFVHTVIPLHAFSPELERLRPELGVRVVRATAHGFRGCDANVPDLLAAVVRGAGAGADGLPARRRTPEQVVLLGYSKGALDALTLLVGHPEVAPRVRSLVSWAGAIQGTPVVDGVYKAVEGRTLDLGRAGDPVLSLLRTVLPLTGYDGVFERADEWDLKAALRDLTTAERTRFLRRHARGLDDLDICFFNVVASAPAIQVPYFQAASARTLSRAVGENDMQVAVEHAQLRTPMSTTLAVVRAHHWEVAMGAFPRTHRFGSHTLTNPFPRGAALVATIQLHRELGLAP